MAYCLSNDNQLLACFACFESNESRTFLYTIQFWDVATGSNVINASISSLEKFDSIRNSHDAYVQSCSFSNDDRFILYRTSLTLGIIEVESHSLVYQLGEGTNSIGNELAGLVSQKGCGAYIAACLSNDNQFLVYAQAGGTLKVVNLALDSWSLMSWHHLETFSLRKLGWEILSISISISFI